VSLLVFKTSAPGDPRWAGSIPVRLRYCSDLHLCALARHARLCGHQRESRFANGLLTRSLREQRVEGRGRTLLERRGHVAVQVRGDPDGGMAEAAGYDLQVNPGGQHQGRVSMAKSVEAEIHTRPRGDVPKRL
jgi:hypothetical protein